MKCIIISDIHWTLLSKKGEILNVKDGYGSFLIKDNKAIVASAENLRNLDRSNERKKVKEEELIKECEGIKKKLEATKLEFKVKVGESDKVFGSVSAKQIEKELKSLGYNIDKKSIIINSSLSSLGTHIVDIELHKKVVAKIKVNLVK